MKCVKVESYGVETGTDGPKPSVGGDCIVVRVKCAVGEGG
jgi:hypothetical protein